MDVLWQNLFCEVGLIVVELDIDIIREEVEDETRLVYPAVFQK